MKAYTTLLSKAEYLPGCLVVADNLRSVGSRYPLVVMVTPQLEPEARAILERRGIPTHEVLSLLPDKGVHKLADHDARFQDTWTKLRAFELMEYERIVLMDSDMIVRRNMDELFDLELDDDMIAAAHACACNPRKLAHYPKDWIPANCAYTPLVHPDALTKPTAITGNSPRPYNLLNSGLIVLRPSQELSQGVYRFLQTSPLVPTFNFPDQDLLAEYFRGKWKPIPWCYNALKTLRNIHKQLWRDEEVRCLHYILADKPWKKRVSRAANDEDGFLELNLWWWDAFDKLAEDLKQTDPKAYELVISNVAST